MIFKAFCFIAAGLAIQFVFNMLIAMDINKRVYNHRPGNCRRIKGVDHGSEDIALIESKAIAFVTSGLVYLPDPNKPITHKGKIFMYDFKQKAGEHKVKELPISGIENQDDFHPHGISHWILADGRIRLFVVTHSKKFLHAVFLLDYDEKTQSLKVFRVVRDPTFVRPNDVVATGDEQFIVSNDGGAQTQIGNMLEMFFFDKTGSMAYYDGHQGKFIYESGRAANGIILAKDGKHLLVSHINHEIIGVYHWHSKNQTMTRVSEVPLATSIDNFYIDKNNVLWTGAHPVLKDALPHLGDPTNLKFHAPSQVLRIEFAPDFQSWEVSEVLADDGRFVSASSIAVEFQGQILVGSVARELVHCDIAHESVIAPSR